MVRLPRRARGRPALVLALLAASLALSATPSVAGKASPVDWSTMNSNPSNTNSVSQDQITPSNVGSLQYAWTFPFPLSGDVPGLNVTGQGAISPPLVVDGIVYVVTNFLTVYAIDGETGDVVWSYAAKLNTTGLPLGTLTGHMHGINYYRGDVWVSLPDCSVLALDALTGSPVTRITDICKDIPGNEGYYDSSGVPPVFYGDTMIWTSSVSEGTDVGRGFVAAYNITSGSLLWRWYVSPPAGGDPTWDSSSCPPPCHGNVAPFPGDWGSMGMTTVVNGSTDHPLAGASPSFGEPVVDASLGVVFVSTSQPSPDWNGTYRPGPDLYSDSIIALNATDGTMLWYYQTTPHDLYDFDCGWNTVLGSVTQSGKAQDAVFKACKNGYVYALGAATGSLIWYFDPPAVARSFTGNADYAATRNYSADLPWANYPSTGLFEQCPGRNGAVESDIAFADSKVFVATFNLCTASEVGSVNTQGSGETGLQFSQAVTSTANTTIYAVDASTGRQVWSHLIPAYAFRGWLTASNRLIYAGSPDGSIHVLNWATGVQVFHLHVGPVLYDSPTLGSAADGRVYLYELIGSASVGAFLGPVPGSIMAFTLPPGSSAPSTSGLLWPAALTAAAAAGVVSYVVVRRRRRAR